MNRNDILRIDHVHLRFCQSIGSKSRSRTENSVSDLFVSQRRSKLPYNAYSNRASWPVLLALVPVHHLALALLASRDGVDSTVSRLLGDHNIDEPITIKHLRDQLFELSRRQSVDVPNIFRNPLK